MAKINHGFSSLTIIFMVILPLLLVGMIINYLNPTERAKGERDKQREAKAVELLKIYDSYFASYGCYPWAGGAGESCEEGNLAGGSAFHPDFESGGNSERLLYSQKTNEAISEKADLRSRETRTRLWVSVDVTEKVSICYEPEAINARHGDLWRLRNKNNTADQSCQTDIYPDESCFLCVPK